MHAQSIDNRKEVFMAPQGDIMIVGEMKIAA